MTTWRPAMASDPDDADEWRFEPLDEHDPTTARHLVDRFAWVWLPAARLPMSRLSDVADTVELLIARSWAPSDRTLILRLRSWYTGTTNWMPDWNGRAESAQDWIEDVAEMCGDWVTFERDRYGERPPWDE